ncbi:cytochrome c oxidase subunit II [Methylobacter sp.]|uniref:cytochrome c oxidase subunit II n=1 Tax=Methylobacter sp. TaxID=2051955 RepID=UPI002FDC7D92
MRYAINKTLCVMALLVIAGCGDKQSAFAGLGPVSSRITLLIWIMFIGAALITVLISVLMLISITGPAGWRHKLAGEKSIVWGGIVFPVVTLTALLIYGFLILKAGATLVHAEDPVHISVVGEQWWWRVIYRHDDGHTTESANELRIPTGRSVEIKLSTADVIHSFWIPAYAGKIDMIPGRINTLHFSADKPGIATGQCAEYCGGAHALMSFYTVAMAPSDYEAWVAKERANARQDFQSEGEQLFLSSGCGGCHTIRGSQADGKIGPDLTHVGNRLSLGAGILPNTTESFAKWISQHQTIKPENLMPPFDIFSENELQSLAAYLNGLE